MSITLDRYLMIHAWTNLLINFFVGCYLFGCVISDWNLSANLSAHPEASLLITYYDYIIIHHYREERCKELVNKPNRHNWTPLSTALECNNKDAVKILLDKGAGKNKYS